MYQFYTNRSQRILIISNTNSFANKLHTGFAVIMSSIISCSSNFHNKLYLYMDMTDIARS